MCILKKLSEFAFGIAVVLIRVSFVYIVGLASVVCSMNVNILDSSADIIIEDNLRNVVSAIKVDYDPYNSLDLVGAWQEIHIAGQQESPAQLGQRFYRSSVEASLAAFNNTINVTVNHGSVCAVTCVYNMNIHQSLWAVNTMVLDGLFVSGRINNMPNGMCVQMHQQGAGIPWGNQWLRDVFCFPAQNAGLDSHSERAIVSLLSNTALGMSQFPGTLRAVLIHIKNMMAPCLNCYHAMRNARAVRNNNVFVDGKGLADIYSNGEDPTDIVTNNANFDNNELTAVGNIPVSIGIGHYREPLLPGEVWPGIDWYDKYWRAIP